tara:strand:+ start:58 stop:468 length:411 start_codon:yes stop_codon:yes gene_type:complete
MKIENIINKYITASIEKNKISQYDLKYELRKLNLDKNQSEQFYKKLELEWDLIEHLYIKIRLAKTNLIIGIIITFPIIYYFWWLINLSEEPLEIDIRLTLGALISPFIIFISLIKKKKYLKVLEIRKGNWARWTFD